MLCYEIDHYGLSPSIILIDMTETGIRNFFCHEFTIIPLVKPNITNACIDVHNDFNTVSNQ